MSEHNARQLLRALAEIDDLREVLRNLVNKLDECNEAMIGYWVFLAQHNNEYQGPTYEKEIDAARVFVQTRPAPKESK